MKAPDLSKYFRTLREFKFEDLSFSSLSDSISTKNISIETFKEPIISFISVKRNRIILSSGIASILLLSILPQKVELLINRKSILSDYMSEASLLDELQDEVISVDSSLKDKTLLKSRILDLIPIKQQAEKVLPIILTNLINSSSLRLVEILPSNETSYLSNSDDELFADIVDFDDPEEFSDEEEFLSEDDFEFDDAGASSFDNENDFIDESPDPFSQEQSTSDLSGSELSVTPLFYTIKVQGEPQNLYDFFDNLHTIKLLNSIGRVSYSQETSSSGTSDSSFSSQPSSASSSPLNTITMDFTLKVAVQSLPEITLPSSNSLEILPLDGDDGLSSTTDLDPQSFPDLPPLTD